MKFTKENFMRVVLRKIKKWLGIVPPLSEDWKPWEEQNCDLSMTFKEDNYDCRN